MIAWGSLVDSFAGLRHALAYADEIRRRCVKGGEAIKHVAASLDLDVEQAEGVARILRAVPTLSPERAALVAMRDPGLNDSDIAEMFGRSVRWARIVREQADEIRSEEPIPEHLEYLDAGLQRGDPTPAEIQAMALALRKAPEGHGSPRSTPVIRTYSYTNNAFISVGAQ